ncbi:ROK family protein [Nocardioides zhouii]|uniref:ROK family protein n=1 Tax=Nocardioides zhouii TaxID=1168729 RepID=UPI001A9219D3|nr:ROK family protein [Nocardioides zhouii]
MADVGATSIEVALSDLAGNLSHTHDEIADVTVGPTEVLSRVAALFDELIAALPDGTRVWGVGLGLPGPVEFETGRPVAPPIMPGWDGYGVREFMAARFGVPVWIDNDVNLMALGELRGGLAAGHRDVVLVKVGTGIGAGLVSHGLLHRGAQGCAGDIGHTAVRGSTALCRCGQHGCLEALAGGAALARDGLAMAIAGTSPALARAHAEGHEISAETVIRAAHHGDVSSRALVIDSARLLGEALARVVNFFNPSLVVIGGGVAAAGDLYLAELRQSVIGRSLPLATRTLDIILSPLADRAGLRGAAFMVVDELLSPARLSAPSHG